MAIVPSIADTAQSAPLLPQVERRRNIVPNPKSHIRIFPSRTSARGFTANLRATVCQTDK
jgi:hypothetical protein